MRSRLTITTLLILSLSGAAAAQEAPKDQTPEAVAALNQAYAEHLGVSVEQAIAYQARVAQALELDGRFRRERPDYVGLRIAEGPQFRATFDFTGDASAALAAATSDPDFVARQVAFSPATIQQALDTLAATLRPISGGHTIYFDDRTQRLKVHARAAAPVRTLLTAVRLAIPIDVVEDDFIVQVTADLEGGRAVNANGETCTAGFSVVRSSDNRKGITTAGHCPNTNVRFEGTAVPFMAELYNSGRDVQWHSSTTDSFTPHVWVGTGYLTIQQVTSLASGVPVCMQGAVNSNRCGRTDIMNATGTDNNGVSFSNAVSFKRDDGSFMVSKGDSGASMVTAPNSIGTAHGVQFAGASETFSGSGDFRVGLYVKASDLSLMGVAIQTRPPY